MWSTGQDIRLPNGKVVVGTQCSVNAFEPKDLNVIRNPLLTAKAVDRQPAVFRSEMRCFDLGQPTPIHTSFKLTDWVGDSLSPLVWGPSSHRIAALL